MAARSSSDDIPRIDATQKLTEDQEREIVWRYVFGLEMENQRQLAEAFDVSQATISKIVREYASHTGTELELSIINEYGGDSCDV